MTQSPFGLYLRKKRVESGKSLREVADHVGVSHVYLSQVERGKTTPLSDDRWEKLIEVIPGIERDELLDLSAVSRPIQVDLSQLSSEKQKLGLLLTRKLEEIPDDKASDILRLLKGDED